MTVGGRTHLSIGEVLSLLQDDFPDLTITKIRFLESQGLIDPERTPSGYRKFYEFDIERLRWILRQQRENFLPLKVIKGRLDGADGALPVDADGPAQEQLDIARDPGPDDPPPIWMADHAKAAASVATPAAPVIPAGIVSRPLRSADGDAPTPDTPATRLVPATTTPVSASTPVSKSAAGELRTVSAEQAPSIGATGATATKPSPSDRPQEAAVTPSGSKPPSAPTAASPASAQTPTPATPTGGRDPLDIGFTDVAMTRDELLAAAKLSESQLGELESFGIVTPATTSPDPVYGAEALLCARHASTFFSLGVEARHLRAYKVAADREAGLYEQLILPLLRQRNPAARAEATATLRRLAASGAAIHAALLHQSLRPHLRPEP